MIEWRVLCAYDREVTKVLCAKGSMSPLLLQEDRNASQVVQRLSAFSPVGAGIFLACCWRVDGASLAMAISKSFPSSPIQLSNTRGILCANRAPALVNERFAVV
jgi:hypothetical protein